MDLFKWNGWVLTQDTKGVPIGGYLSAQLMCICALVQELSFVESPGAGFNSLLLDWDRRALPKIALKPGPSLTFPTFAWVPKDTQTFNVSGMQGWFESSWKHLGALCVLGVQSELHALVLWDSHPEGRVSHIIQSAPRRQHFFLRNYFLNVDPLKCMLGESTSMPELVCDQPTTLLTRYMDNTYVAFCNVPPQVLHVAKAFLIGVQKALYQVPFKWEPESRFLHWAECCVSCTPRALSLTLKGFQPGFFDPSVWDRWPDRWSPSCCLVLQSVVPALVIKSVMFALRHDHQAVNVDGVVTGFGYKGYR